MLVSTRLSERAPVIPAVLRRHVEDGAFYWTQLDGSIDSPQLDADRAAQFGGLLTAHLEGVRVGRQDAASMALQALERWRKPGEAFVAFLAAMSLEGENRVEAVEAVLRQVRRRPDLLVRGAASALAWVDAAAARRWLATVTEASDPVDLVIALRGSALMRGLVADLDRLLAHDSAPVRAAACRCADAALIGALDGLASDGDLAVRAEAAIALARTLSADAVERRMLVASRLWQCVSEQVSIRDQSTGWGRLQSERRLNRWTRHLVLLAPVGHPGMRELVKRLPERVALTAMLHHGDPALLDLVVQLMRNPEQARWAGWVWHCLTGVNIEAEGLVLDEPEIDLDAPLTIDRRDADLGLALPDPTRIMAYMANRPLRADGRRVLLGQPAEEGVLRHIVAPDSDLPQGLRFVAANGLSVMRPEMQVNIRARPDLQDAALRSIGVL